MPYDPRTQRETVAAALDRVDAAIYRPVAELTVEAWRTLEPVPFAERQQGEYLRLRPGDKWGSLFDCAWFHFAGTIPAETTGHPVVLLIDLNGEACLVDEHGEPRLGLTTVNSLFDFALGKPGKRVVPVTTAAVGGEPVSVWADAGCNDLFGRLKENGVVKEASIAILHPVLRGLYYDLEVLQELAGQLPPESARARRLWQSLDDAVGVLCAMTEAEAAQARAILAPELSKRGGESSLRISAVGHAHIDLAWLWPIRETLRKGARTFATALQLMERYPDYVFGASQPQLYQWIQRRHPALFARVKARVAEGRWEVQGGMWVEPDTNIPNGESLVRQLLHGKRYFRREFGIDVRNLWLPDSFGYSGVLPQLCRQAGIDFFVTQKLSSSLLNRYPHHTFHWEGIDGSTVLAHLLPEETYNSSAAPRALAKIERNFADAGLSSDCLMLFGIGDGGGGPGEEHLERLARERDLQGVAPVVQEPAAAFFTRLAAADTGRYPRWVGELYLDRHQYTLTTQGRAKAWNRAMERSLHDAEWLSAWGRLREGAPYPVAELEEIWQETLLYQFHDILPGSSIGRVYAESLVRYAALYDRSETLAQTAARRLTETVDTSAFAQPVVVWNSLSWPRREYVRLPSGWNRVEVPALGYVGVEDAQVPSPTASTAALENDLLRVSFSPDGALVSVWDKAAGREALAPGEAANRLTVYRDSGDAWDAPTDYRQHPRGAFALAAAEAAVEGPQAILVQRCRYGESTLTQRIILTSGSRRLDFVTAVEWRETGAMLRTAFPVGVTSDFATCGIQFGAVRRPTHRNTSWDFGKEEVSGQQWVDLSDRGYGVGLLSVGKYGHRVQGHTLDLNLLRAPSHPDPEADRGHHEFTYALYPHVGDHVEGGVVRAARELNQPLRLTPAAAHPGAQPPTASLCQVDGPHLVVETVKKAEDDDRLVVRLVEAHGASGVATLRLGCPVQSVQRVNLLEEAIQQVPTEGNSVTLTFRPYEIISLAVNQGETA
jgi:alpha-mannosidase